MQLKIKCIQHCFDIFFLSICKFVWIHVGVSKKREWQHLAAIWTAFQCHSEMRFETVGPFFAQKVTVITSITTFVTSLISDSAWDSFCYKFFDVSEHFLYSLFRLMKKKKLRARYVSTKCWKIKTVMSQVLLIMLSRQTTFQSCSMLRITVFCLV